MNGLGVDFAGMERAALSTALTQVAALVLKINFGTVFNKIPRTVFEEEITPFLHMQSATTTTAAACLVSHSSVTQTPLR